MKPYRDAFGNPLTKKDVTLAVAAAVQHPTVTAMTIQRETKLGVSKSHRIVQLLQNASVLSAPKENGRVVILRDRTQAINAALRQLKRGKKS